MKPARMLILAPHVERRRSGSRWHLDSPSLSMTIGGLAPAADGAFERLRHGVEDGELGLPDALVESMVAHDLLGRLAAAPEALESFLVDFFRLCDTWTQGIFASPFWPRFLAGSASEQQVWAFLSHLYHRTAGADLHNRIAVERCQVAAIRPLLERHYREECGHAAILAEGLHRCGERGRAIVDGPALPLTCGLIHYMLTVSAEAVAYLGCYGIFHAPSTIRTEAELIAQFSRFGQMYPYAAPGFEAVCRHSRLDYQLRHDEIALERWLGETGPPRAADVAAILRGARGAAIAFRTVFYSLYRVV